MIKDIIDPIKILKDWFQGSQIESVTRQIEDIIIPIKILSGHILFIILLVELLEIKKSTAIQFLAVGAIFGVRVNGGANSSWLIELLSVNN